MSFTSRLGNGNSRLANIILGSSDQTEVHEIVESILNFSHDVTTNGSEAEGENALALVDSATAVRDIVISVSDTMTLADSLNKEELEDIEDTLTLVDEATGAAEKHVSVSQTLTFVQVARPNIVNIDVSQTLSFVQDVQVQAPIYITINHNLGLSQPVDGHLGVVNLSLEDELNLTDRAGRVIEISVTQMMTLTDEGDRIFPVAHALAFVQTAQGGKGKSASNTLTFNQAVVNTAILNRSITTTLGLLQSTTYFVVNSCVEKNYTPFIGSGGDTSYTAPTTTAPTLGSATLTLTYPFVSPTSTLVLRNPQFQDRNRLTFNRIQRETRGGTLVVFADPKWPKVQTLEFEIRTLKAQQVLDLLQFFRDSLGKEVGLLDHENRQWRGIILNPDADIFQSAREDRGFTLSFQGTLV